MRRSGTGNVNFVHLRMRAQIAPHLGPAAHNAQRVTVDQRFQRGLKVFRQIVVHRIHLQDNHLMFDKQLLKGIQRRDGGDVARTQHQRHLALPLPRRGVIGLCRVLRQVGRSHVGLHPDICRHTRQQQSVPDRMRHHTHRQLPVRRLPCRKRRQKRLALHLRQGLDQPVAGRHHRIRPRGPFLAHQGRT